MCAYSSLAVTGILHRHTTRVHRLTSLRHTHCWSTIFLAGQLSNQHIYMEVNSYEAPPFSTWRQEPHQPRKQQHRQVHHQPTSALTQAKMGGVDSSNSSQSSGYGSAVMAAAAAAAAAAGSSEAAAASGEVFAITSGHQKTIIRGQQSRKNNGPVMLEDSQLI